MKIATWNVNSIRARRERVLGWLRSREPDIVCLQETKVVTATFPRRSSPPRDTAPSITVKILQWRRDLEPRRPRRSDSGFEDGGGDADARLIAATAAGIRVLSVYVPNGRAPGTPAFRYKLEWLRRLREYLDRHFDPSQPLVVCGDFNVAPDDRDVHDPLLWEGETHCTPAERAAFSKVVGFGLEDTFRRHHSGGGAYSWWDYRMLAFPKNRGLRIDCVLATAALASACTRRPSTERSAKGRRPPTTLRSSPPFPGRADADLRMHSRRDPPRAAARSGGRGDRKRAN